MRELLDLLGRRSLDVTLDVAALQLASVEQPGLEPEPYLELLESYSRELSARATPDLDGEDFVAVVNHYLFDELGFEGNQDDYYNPSNSCLNQVLLERRGIPITLAVVYLELARRLERPVSGIALPGHFLVRYDDGLYATFIDPFHGGRLLQEEDCLDLAHSITGRDISSQPHVLKPVDNRLILIRMCNNLRSIYFQNSQLEKAIQVLDLLIEAEPGYADEYKQRAVCKAQLQLLPGAAADFETYLKLAPAAADRDEVERHVESIRSILRRAR